MAYHIGTKEKPLALKTPPLTGEYTMHVDEKDGREILVCTVGKTVLLYNLRCIDDLHTMLKNHGDWMELGSAETNKSRQRKERLRHGPVRRTTPQADGMALKKDSAAVSACIFPP